MENVAAVTERAFTNFLQAISNDNTLKTYKDGLANFMRFCEVQEPAKLLDGNSEFLEDRIKDYIAFQKKEEVSSSLIYTRLAAVRLFYESNRKVLAWKFIKKGVGRGKKRKDRAYTTAEIKKMLDVGDLRDRALILTMASAGLRVGALPELTVGSIHRIENGVCKIRVHEGENEEYITFCTPECTAAIDRYLEHRREYGEQITPESPLFRKEYNTAIHGSARLRVRPMKQGSLKKVISDLVNKSGVREKIHPTETLKASKIRYPVKRAHGFRKFFATQLNAAYNNENPLMVEMLLGHDTGLTGVYTKPSDESKESFYVGGVDYLTISEENKLRRVVTEQRNTLQQLMDSINSKMVKGEL